MIQTPNDALVSVTPASPSQGAPLRLGVMASGSGSNFEAIAAAIDAGQLQATIQVMIYNNPGAKVCDRAQRFKVPAVLHNHRDVESREALDLQIVETLQSL